MSEKKQKIIGHLKIFVDQCQSLQVERRIRKVNLFSKCNFQTRYVITLQSESILFKNVIRLEINNKHIERSCDAFIESEIRP